MSLEPGIGGKGGARLLHLRLHHLFLHPRQHRGGRKSGAGDELFDDGVPLEPTPAPREGLVILDNLPEPSRRLVVFSLTLTLRGWGWLEIHSEVYSEACS